MKKHDIQTGEVYSYQYAQNLHNKSYIKFINKRLRSFLIRKEKHLSKMEVIEMGLSLDEFPILPAIVPDFNSEDRYVNLLESQIVEPVDEDCYPLFLFLRLMQLNVLEIDDFLTYQAELYKQQTGNDFLRLINLCKRQWFDDYPTVSESTAVKRKEANWLTVEEWLNQQSQNLIDKSMNQSETHWKGTKTEFIQLIYGIFKAGKINNESQSAPDLVEYMAKCLQIDLGEKWQNLLSNSISRTSADYEPKIFDEIKLAYRSYVKKKEEK